MKVMVVGASGAIGTRLVPQLSGRGHEVIGTFRSPGKAERVRALGAQPVSLDLLIRGAVHKAVLDVHPDAIIHEATDLANAGFSRSLDKTFAGTNRLRTEGTDNLLAAAREAGVRRLVAQSFAPYRYIREGAMIKIADDDSAPMSEWLPALASALGAKRPFRIPVALGNVVMGKEMVKLSLESRGASNAKAKKELGWTLRYPSWRQGFPASATR